MQERKLEATKKMSPFFKNNGRKSSKYVWFVCHYWQWPILINCVKCYYLCVLRWLMRPILALNCLLQIEQDRSVEESSVSDALALAFRYARFCSDSLIFLLHIHQRPFLWGLATLFDPVQSVPTTVLECWSLQLVVLHRGFSLANVHQAFW